MKVFISWSGVASRSVAEVLRDWLPKVIQGVKPFVSAKDLDKGSNWTVELTRELKDTDFGIICLAPDNLLSPWLNYEAGAITKSVDSRVAPVLFNVSKSDVQAPLAQLQLTSINIEEFELLMISINKAAGSQLGEGQVKEAVGVWWPSLETAINAIEIPQGGNVDTSLGQAEPVQPQADLTEMIGDVLRQLRTLDHRMGRIERRGVSRFNGDERHGRDRVILRNIGRELSGSGIDPVSVKITEEKIQIELTEVPHEHGVEHLVSIGETVAEREGREVWIETPGRTLVFHPDGRMSEIPF